MSLQDRVEKFLKSLNHPFEVQVHIRPTKERITVKVKNVTWDGLWNMTCEFATPEDKELYNKYAATHVIRLEFVD